MSASDTASKKVAELRQQIQQYNYQYHVLDDPTMPDVEYDRLMRELQAIEAEHIEVLRTVWTKARVRIWTLAEFIEAPMEPLQTVIDEIGPKHLRRLGEAPKMTDLTGFGQFLQNLKNQGMHPYLMGDFPVNQTGGSQPPQPRRPYLVK